MENKEEQVYQTVGKINNVAAYIGSSILMYTGVAATVVNALREAPLSQKIAGGILAAVMAGVGYLSQRKALKQAKEIKRSELEVRAES